MTQATENLTTRLTVICFIASTAMVPMFFYGCGPEWARWDASQAVHYFKIGEVDDALYQLRDAIRKSPRDPVLKLTLASRLLEIEQPAEAIELADAVLEIYPDNANAIEIKSRSQQQSGDFEDALETWLTFDQKLNAISRGPASYNQLAYFRALANTDLDLAKRDIENAIEETNKRIRWPGDAGLTLPIKATVLATLIGRCCDANEESLPEVTRQIKDLQAKIDQAKDDLTKNVYSETKRAFPIRQTVGTLDARQTLRVYESRAAVLLTCRALIYQDENKLLLSQSDRLEVDRLGFDSAKIASSFLDERTAMFYLSQFSAYLDTRGFICSLLSWDSDLPANQKSNFVSNYSSTINDLNVAILCAVIDLKSFDYEIRNSLELVTDKAQAKKAGAKNVAVMLNHRSQTFERVGEHQLAQKDAKRIAEMGFTPGPTLF